MGKTEQDKQREFLATMRRLSSVSVEELRASLSTHALRHLALSLQNKESVAALGALASDLASSESVSGGTESETAGKLRPSLLAHVLCHSANNLF
jgi:hypothetical protein